MELRNESPQTDSAEFGESAATPNQTFFSLLTAARRLGEKREGKKNQNKKNPWNLTTMLSSSYLWIFLRINILIDIQLYALKCCATRGFNGTTRSHSRDTLNMI